MAMKFDLAPVRLGLYIVLTFFSLIMLSLTAARLSYTMNLPRGDNLNGGHDFTDPVIGELLFTSILTMLYSAFAAFTLHKRLEKGVLTSYVAELVGLAGLWMFWLGGMAAATSAWPDLSFCTTRFQACRILTALVTFSWFCWILTSLLLVVNVLFTIANKAWKEPMHGRWDPRGSNSSGVEGIAGGPAMGGEAHREMSNV